MSPTELELLARGRAAFNRGDFYDAHEHWEEVWDEADDPDRRWIQGLIQIATGYHKLAQGHAGPATSLLGRALAKLADAPAAYHGMDVASARARAAEILAALGRGELPDPAGERL